MTEAPREAAAWRSSAPAAIRAPSGEKAPRLQARLDRPGVLGAAWYSLRSLGEAGPARLAGGLVWLYQKAVSPALAAAFPNCGCRFHPTCSHYAREALREHGLLRGAALSAARLARCGPWHPGGFDPVPARRFSCVRQSSGIPAES